jgi:hypothetical protein
VRKPIPRILFHAFVWSFVTSAGSFVLLLATRTGSVREGGLTPQDLTLFALWFAAGLAWYAVLGIVGSRLGKRWPVWIVLSLILPLGSLVAFFLMLAHLRAALTSAEVNPEPDAPEPAQHLHHVSSDETPERSPGAHAG